MNLGPKLNPDFGFPAPRRAAERRHPADRDRMGPPTLQTLQDPILLLPFLSALETLVSGARGVLLRGEP
jgi:hypothetical protein